MREAAADLEFEEAGRIRDEIRKLEAEELGLPVDQQVTGAAPRYRAAPPRASRGRGRANTGGRRGSLGGEARRPATRPFILTRVSTFSR